VKWYHEYISQKVIVCYSKEESKPRETTKYDVVAWSLGKKEIWMNDDYVDNNNFLIVTNLSY
jgi:hypothetical protein